MEALERETATKGSLYVQASQRQHLIAEQSTQLASSVSSAADTNKSLLQMNQLQQRGSQLKLAKKSQSPPVIIRVYVSRNNDVEEMANARTMKDLSHRMANTTISIMTMDQMKDSQYMIEKGHWDTAKMNMMMMMMVIGWILRR